MFRLAAIAEKLADEQPPSSPPQQQIQPVQSSASKTKVRLPKLEVRKFDGKLHESAKSFGIHLRAPSTEMNHWRTSTSSPISEDSLLDLQDRPLRDSR